MLELPYDEYQLPSGERPFDSLQACPPSPHTLAHTLAHALAPHTALTSTTTGSSHSMHKRKQAASPVHPPHPRARPHYGNACEGLRLIILFVLRVVAIVGSCSIAKHTGAELPPVRGAAPAVRVARRPLPARCALRRVALELAAQHAADREASAALGPLAAGAARKPPRVVLRACGRVWASC